MKHWETQFFSGFQGNSHEGRLILRAELGEVTGDGHSVLAIVNRRIMPPLLDPGPRTPSPAWVITTASKTISLLLCYPCLSLHNKIPGTW